MRGPTRARRRTSGPTHARNPARGTKLVRSDPTARIASGKLFLAVQEAWNKAPELMHPALCCKGGHVLEPPLPHMKHRI